MAWTYLLVASAFEIAFAVGLKYTEGFTRLWPSVLTVIAAVASFLILSQSLKALPIGTAYAAWTGIGAVGATVLGIWLFREPGDWQRLVCIGLVVSGVAGLRLTSEPTVAGAAAHNEQLGRRYFEAVWNRGDLDALDELLAPTYVNHTPSVPGPPPGPEGLKPIVRAIREAFPDLHYEVQDVLATDDAVVMRVVMTGTHRGELFGLPPTGRRVEVNQINIERIWEGRIVEHWRVTDELTMMRQLGVVPQSRR